MHYWIGNIGHLSVITAFIASLVSTIGYYFASSNNTEMHKKSWLRFSRTTFSIQVAAIFGIILSLFWIIYNHYYEYHYAFSHSSNNLPTHFMISCFWEGQEGSFLLWIFWHAIIGIFLIKLSGKWESPVMVVFNLVQAFLLSMILGVAFFNTIKIGSSPFVLLREISEAPIFQLNPEFIPQDGNGLNPLLQNYWMVIHPPVLFLGFALALVPFAYSIAGWSTKAYQDWVKPSYKWLLLATVILGVGIIMGAYWAYETLNFGGYWSWDPVENAVYIPWLTLVAAVHLSIIFIRKGKALKEASILVIISFILILYSTFLTRSGVLGDTSVHSFTDLGLSGQLLIYLLFFSVLSGFILMKGWKNASKESMSTNPLNWDFWVFIGAIILCLAGFQVILPTSIPAINKFLNFFGIQSTLAPPAEPVAFYTNFQMWFAVFIALLSSLGQFFYWKNIKKSNLKDAFYLPIILTLILSAVLMTVLGVKNWKYIVLLTVSVFSIVVNASTLIKLIKKKIQLAGGSLAHIGIALMFIGILLSSGYSKVVSINSTGQKYGKDLPESFSKENLLLFRDQPRTMQGYKLTYLSPKMESEDVDGFLNKEELLPTSNPYKAVVKKSFTDTVSNYSLRKGDTLQIYNENTYYEISFEHLETGETLKLYPRVQDNPKMGVAVSPDIIHQWDKDIYTHIAAARGVGNDEDEWSKPVDYTLSMGDTIIINDYIAILENVYREKELLEVDLDQNDIAITANIRVLGNQKDYILDPKYIIKDKSPGIIPDVNRALGLKITLEKINPTDENFTFKVSTTQKDWIIINAMEKPFISLLWSGSILMSIGFLISFYNQFSRKNTLNKKL